MTLPNECGPSSTRWASFLLSAAMDSHSLLWTWYRVENCKSSFIFSMHHSNLLPSSAKYPLAIAQKMLNMFGKDLGGGFNIGCRFGTTLANSPLGPLACELNHTSLVGSFHGHAHRCLCQLSHLATYWKGMGLEDLEGCECAFSKSNSLTPTLRYASAFHRKQAIVTYFEHNDNTEVFQNLS